MALYDDFTFDLTSAPVVSPPSKVTERIFISNESNTENKSEPHFETLSDDTPLLYSDNNNIDRFKNKDMDTDHCHEWGNGYRASNPDRACKKLLTACILCSLFVAGEIVGGLMSSSLSLLGDAAHMFSDLASFVIGLMVIRLGRKEPGKKYNFGYLRAEALGALFTVSLIWYVTGILLYLAIERFRTGDYEVEPDAMMITSGLAVFFNCLLGALFHGHSHGGGSHSHQHINIRAALIHVIGDLIQSFGVFVSSLIIKINPDYKAADPACTIIFSIVVFFTTINILKDTTKILMEGVPPSIKYENVRKTILDVTDSVVSIHDLRIWSLTSDTTALTVHLSVKPGTNSPVKSIVATLKKEYSSLVHVTVQVEDYVESMKRCVDCIKI